MPFRALFFRFVFRICLALLLMALIAGSALEVPSTAWAQTSDGAPVPLAVVPAPSDALDAVVQLGLGDSESSLPDSGEEALDSGEAVLPVESDGFDVTEGLAPDLLPEEIEGHELGSDLPGLGIADLLDDDDVFEWQDGDDTMSLRLLPAREAAAAAVNGSDTVASTSLQDLADSMAAVSYVASHDGLSNETSARVQQQADNWFVSDTGQLFLPVGGVLVLFEDGFNDAEIDAVWMQYGITPGRVLPIEGLPNAFKIDTSSDVESLQLVQLLSQAPGVESVTPNMFTPDFNADLNLSSPTSRYPKLNDAASKRCRSNDPPLSDALSACLWHLDSSTAASANINGQTQSASADINIGDVWDTTMGAGITVSIVDRTWEAGHEDLVGNANRAASTYWGGRTGESNSWHGTAVAGVIGARDNNIGGRGVAPRAQLLNVNYLEYQSTYTLTQRFLHRKDTVAVANHSYSRSGNRDLHRVSPVVTSALEESLKSGFGGKGIVHVKSVGNDKRLGDEGGLEERHNHYGFIVACAVDSAGNATTYSEEGSMLWVCGPSGDTGRFQILAPIGKNSYHSGLKGTSFSAPVVSGVAALVRSANTDLTWRDVKLILAGTAQKNDANDSSWQAGALKYRSTTDSYSYSRKYGFGLVDASAAVAAAKTWKTLPPMFASLARSSESETVTKSGGTKEFTLDLVSDIDFIEYVDVNFNMNTENFNHLKMTLVSPSGRESLLIKGPSGRGWCSCPLNGDFKLASVRHLGETASGTWKLKIANTGDVHPAKLNSWGIKVYGHNALRTEEITLSTPAEVAEGDDFTVTVAHKGTPLATDLVVPIVLVPDGASPPGQPDADYASLTSITIPAGASSASAAVSTIDDSVDEIREKVIVSVGSVAVPYYLASPSNPVVIIDDDKPAVSIRAVKDRILEGEKAAFEFTMHSKPAVPIRVSAAVSEYPFDRDASYLPFTRERTFSVVFTSAGTQTVSFDTVEDRVDDPSRLIWGRILNSSIFGKYRMKGYAAAGIRVSDDLPRVSVVSRDHTIYESNHARFDFSAFPKPSSPITLSVEVTASGLFGVSSGTRTITIGPSGKASLFIGTERYSFGQPRGTATVTIAPSDSTKWYMLPNRNSATVVIRDLDGDGSLYVAAPKLLAKVRTHVANELAQGHLNRANLYKRVLLTFGEDPAGVTGGRMTGAEARTYVDAGLSDWGLITSEVAQLEASRPEKPVVLATAGADIVEGDDAIFTLRTMPAWPDDIDVTMLIHPHGNFGVPLGFRTLTIPAGDTATLTLPTAVDNVGELDGSITVAVSQSDDYDRYMFGQASLSVADNDGPPLPKVSVTAGSAVTEGTAASFTLTANPAPASSLAVNVNVAAIGNYGVTTGSRTVTIGTSGTATLTVSTTGDSTDEANGSVTATLSAGTGYTLSSTSSTATVAVADDDDPTVYVVPAGLISDVRGYAAETGNGAVHVNRWKRVLLAFGESVPGFTGTPMTLVEAQGFAKQFWSVRWDPVVKALQALAANAPLPGTPVVSVTAGSGITEGSIASFELTVSPASASPLSVNFTVTATGDYGAITGSQTVTIAVKGTLKIVTKGDSTDEPNGSVTITLNAGTGYDLDSTASTATVAVADDDDPPPATPVVSVTAGSAVTEGSNASFTLTADPAPAASVDVTVAVTATGDYGVTIGSRTVTIGTSGTATLTVSTTGDTTDEADGSVTAAISTGTGYTVSSSASTATVTINDDDASSVVSAQLIANVRGYAAETSNGAAHVNRWKRVLLAFGESVPGFIGTPITLTEAQDFAKQFWNVRWDPVVTALQALTTNTPQPSPPPATPVVSVVAGGAVTEGSSASFTLTADPAPAASLTVNVAVTATGDYGVTAGSRTVTIPTTGSATLTISTTGDSTDEVDGSVTATLNAGSGYSVSTTSATATVAVNDDDPPLSPLPATPVISIAAGGAVTEGSNASFTLTASPAPASSLRVTVAVTATGDYGVTTGTRTVTIGTTGTATLTVSTTGDSTDEANGSVTVTLVDGAAYDLGSTSTATVNIADDDDPPPTPVVSATAGNAVTEGTAASFTLTANPAPASSVRVTVNVTATGDYGVITGSRTFTIGTTGTATLTVSTTGDSTDEPNGSVTVTLIDGAAYNLNTSASSATVAVTDDDVPAVSVTAGSGVTEGSNASFTLTANPAPHANITVNVTVTATGSYGITTGTRTVTIPTTGTATLTISTTGDSTNEPNGSVTVTVTDGVSYDVASTVATATVAISDDDPPSPADAAVLSVGDVVVGEDEWFALVAVRLSKPAANDVEFIFATVATGFGTGHATLGADVRWVGRSGKISKGQTLAWLSVTIRDDNLDEPDETFKIVLSDPEGAVIGDGEAIITIKDDD